MESKHDTILVVRARRGLLAIGAASLLTALSACASTTLQAPPGHPARSDTPAAPAADPAAVLLPNAAEPSNAQESDGEMDGMDMDGMDMDGMDMDGMHHQHGAAEAPATPESSEDVHDGHGSQDERSSDETDEETDYTCSMHPSVKQATPGTCPICGMELVPVPKETENAEPPQHQHGNEK